MEALTPGLAQAVGQQMQLHTEQIGSRRVANMPPLPAVEESKKRKRDDDDKYDAELQHDRYLNDMKLKSRFEHIFSKYGKSFDGVGDEVDLVTGELVVDNGHLQNMRTDLDLGGNHRGRLSEMLDADPSDAGDTEDEDEDQDVLGEDDHRWDGQGQDQEGERGEQQQYYADEPATDQELDEVDDLRDFIDDDDDEADPEEDIEGMSDDDYATDIDGDDSAPARPVDVEKNVWIDAPRLPGDVGYDPFADGTHRPGFSSSALKEFESSVTDQISQLVDVLAKQKNLAHLDEKTAAGLKPQITIDLDPASDNYGKPVVSYVPVSGPPKPAAPAAQASNFFRELQRQNDVEAEEILKRPKDIAANVLARIAEAGLPTVPGPNGKFPAYRSKVGGQKYRTKAEKDSAGTADALEANEHAIPIDPALEEAYATEMQAEALAAEDGPATSTSEEQYPANTARPLEKKTFLAPGTPFSEEDDELILELKDNRNMLWEDIRDLCFHDRRVTALQYRYYTYLKSNCNKKFTAEDDKLIVQLREQDKLTWPAIQRSYFTEFNTNQLQYRYYHSLCQVRKSPWTKDHDALLSDLKDQQGLTWQQIKDQHFPNRTVGQVQYRYYKNCRPADWREQLQAMNTAYDQAEEADDEEPQQFRMSSVTGASVRYAGKGTLMWSLRRRLAGASDKLTDIKIRQRAEKRRKLQEEKQREANRVAAQEVRRQVRETQNLAKIQALREAQEARRPKPRFTNRDVAGVSPEPELPSKESTPEPASPEPKVEQGPQTAREIFESLIDQYEDYEDPRCHSRKRRPGRRMLADEEDERLRRANQRHLFERAVQVGPLLLPKPPPEEGPGPVLSAPTPSELPEDILQTAVPSRATTVSVEPAQPLSRYGSPEQPQVASSRESATPSSPRSRLMSLAIDPLLLATSTTLPQVDDNTKGSVRVAKRPVMAPMRVHYNPVTLTVDVAAAAVADGDITPASFHGSLPPAAPPASANSAGPASAPLALPSLAPATAPTGPVSRIWTVPKLLPPPRTVKITPQADKRKPAQKQKKPLQRSGRAEKSEPMAAHTKLMHGIGIPTLSPPQPKTATQHISAYQSELPGFVDDENAPDWDDSVIDPELSRTRDTSQEDGESVERNITCPECEKMFGRPCDLARHKAIHRRPGEIYTTTRKPHLEHVLPATSITAKRLTVALPEVSAVRQQRPINTKSSNYREVPAMLGPAIVSQEALGTSTTGTVLTAPSPLAALDVANDSSMNASEARESFNQLLQPVQKQQINPAALQIRTAFGQLLKHADKFPQGIGSPRVVLRALPVAPHKQEVPPRSPAANGVAGSFDWSSLQTSPSSKDATKEFDWGIVFDEPRTPIRDKDNGSIVTGSYASESSVHSISITGEDIASSIEESHAAANSMTELDGTDDEELLATKTAAKDPLPAISSSRTSPASAAVHTMRETRPLKITSHHQPNVVDEPAAKPSGLAQAGIAMTDKRASLSTANARVPLKAPTQKSTTQKSTTQKTTTQKTTTQKTTTQKITTQKITTQKPTTQKAPQHRRRTMPVKTLSDMMSENTWDCDF